MQVVRAWLICVGMGAVACAPSVRSGSSTPVVQSAPTHAATGTVSPALPRGSGSQPTAAGAELPDLFVRCEDGASCPAAVGMLVVAGDPSEEPGRCTVTLIRRDRVLTASHCLAPVDRRRGSSCSRTWVLFPETAAESAESIACERVLAATEVAGDDALQQEHAVLQLARASARLPLTIDPHPPEAGSIVTVASITPHPIYGTTHALSTRLCRVIDSAPARRELGEAAANVGWLASCPIARGNSGSPVLDYEGRIRAIVHGGTSIHSQFGVTSSLSE